MQISKAEINNYRNITKATISFDPECNFIVGENNIGKSNILYLFQIIFNHRAFRDSDFKDCSTPIEILLQLSLTDVEIGNFEDLFEATDYRKINITCRQISPEDNLEFFHTETGTYIRQSVLRNINYIHYDSLRNPVTEVNFDKSKGAGKFLTNIISSYLKEKGLKDADFLKEESINELLNDLNTKISKIKSFADFNINAYSDNNLENLLSKIVVLRDIKGDSLTRSGYGVQFLILIMLAILEKIQAILSQRGERGIFENEQDGTRHISLILGLDEPEIHLHPFMQRSLIKYLNDIITNCNSDFQKLIKELFSIDKFSGQIIIVTHSPNILLNNYKQIIRLFEENGTTNIISGSDIIIEKQLHKTLYRQFPFIKEAFFSRCIIFVEGDTEEACFPHFASKMLIDFDDHGICVIQSRGGGVNAIGLLMKLASKFLIPSVGIGDRDNNSAVNAPLYITTKRDFEDELVCLVENGKESFLRDLVNDLEGANAVVQAQQVNNSAHKIYRVISTPITTDLQLSAISSTDKNLLKAFYLTWLSGKKSYLLGKLIGEKIELSDIPDIYKTVINDAVNRAK